MSLLVADCSRNSVEVVADSALDTNFESRRICRPDYRTDSSTEWGNFVVRLSLVAAAAVVLLLCKTDSVADWEGTVAGRCPFRFSLLAAAESVPFGRMDLCSSFSSDRSGSGWAKCDRLGLVGTDWSTARKMILANLNLISLAR